MLINTSIKKIIGGGVRDKRSKIYGQDSVEKFRIQNNFKR